MIGDQISRPIIGLVFIINLYMVKLSPKDFLQQLDEMYKKQPAGSIYITFKHFNGHYSVKKSGMAPFKSLPGVPEQGTPILLVHAKDGLKKKISVNVPGKEIVNFQMQLDKLMKRNISFQKPVRQSK